MLSPLLTTISLAVLAVVVTVLAVALFSLSRKHRQLKRDHEDLTEIMHGHNNDIRELFGTSMTVDDRLKAMDVRLQTMDGQLRVMSSKISDTQQNELSSHPYGSAIQKVRSGASVSELMHSAGLSQDEAALLIRLHGPKP
jgi:Protein of unknown function (DUF2802)